MYEDVKENYTTILNKRFLDNREKLIESFIEYYGEEYRDRIRSIYDNTIIVYYVGNNITALLDTHNLWRTELNQLQNKLLKMEIDLSNSDLTDEEKENIRYIGSNKTDTFNNEELSAITNIAITTTKSNNALKLLWTFNGKTNRFIFFPAYLWKDSTIIHEMNHHMTSDDLVLVETDNGSSHIGISGLNIDGYGSSNQERIIEELINDMSAIEITEIFHSKGGSYLEENLSKKSIIGESDYQNNFYLIEKFYTYFKDVIKKARITGNKNLLLQTCGEENYYKLVNLINQYYNTGFTQEKSKEIDKVFEAMVSYRKNLIDDTSR